MLLRLLAKSRPVYGHVSGKPIIESRVARCDALHNVYMLLGRESGCAISHLVPCICAMSNRLHRFGPTELVACTAKATSYVKRSLGMSRSGA